MTEAFVIGSDTTNGHRLSRIVSSSCSRHSDMTVKRFPRYEWKRRLSMSPSSSSDVPTRVTWDNGPTAHQTSVHFTHKRSLTYSADKDNKLHPRGSRNLCTASFCCCGLDLDPMTLKPEHTCNLDILMMLQELLTIMIIWCRTILKDFSLTL